MIYGRSRYRSCSWGISHRKVNCTSPHQFYKLPSPNLPRSSHSLTIVKGKAYVYGGDVQRQESDNTVYAITLPSDLALKDTDYQCISTTVAPNPPLASDSDDPSASSETQKNVIPTPRALISIRQPLMLSEFTSQRSFPRQ